MAAPRRCPEGISALFLLTCLIHSAAAAPAAGGNGYVMSFTGMHQLASTRVLTLDATDPEISKLAVGFTVMMWARFHGERPGYPAIHFQLVHRADGNMVQPFAGLQGGYEFGGTAPATVSTTADKGRGWHHYAMTWDQASGNRTHYVDGTQVASDNTAQGHAFLSDEAYITFANCYPNSHLNPYQQTDCNNDQRFTGELDDVAVFGGALTQADISAKWNTALSDATGSFDKTNLVIFWNFDELKTETDFTYVTNKGTSGVNYDLRLGGMPKIAIFGTQYTTGGGAELYDIVAPGIVPSTDSSSWAVPKPLSKLAPIVVVADPGEQVAAKVNAIAGGSTFASYTTPVPFNVPYIDTSTFSGVEVRVLPRVAPTTPASNALSSHGNEDMAQPITIYTYPQSGEATYQVTQLPQHGTLFDIGANVDNTAKTTVIAQDQVLTENGTAYVLYQPNADEVGSPLDTFTYIATDGSMSSAPVTVSVTVFAANDIPVAVGTSKNLTEDMHPNGVLIPVGKNDKELNAPLDLMITKLPQKGKLYQTADGTLTGTRTLINKEYNMFAVAIEGMSPVAYYLDSVTRVSSFWGNPPSTGYHPVTITGPPDCYGVYGECSNTAAWSSDLSIYPEVGERVAHRKDDTDSSGILAYVTGYDTAAGTVTIDFHTMYKDDSAGNSMPCVMSDPASMVWPTDCKHEDWDSATKNPQTGRVTKTVPRDRITAVNAGVWCPLNKGLAGVGGDKNLTGGGFFGPNFAFVHNQKGHYTQGYTEYIEATIEKEVYPVRVEIGSPRGMGLVTGIKFEDSSGNWITVYSGKALVDEQRQYQSVRSYWTWAPESCRVHFKSKHVRIEVDSSSETGISDWNYIDYVKVYGVAALQPAALPSTASHVVYVPDKDSNGADSFELRASDCPGELFRFSDPAVVGFSTTPVNDAPVAGITYATMFTGERMKVALDFSDVDNPRETLIVTLDEVDSLLTVSESGDTKALAKGDTLPADPTHLHVLSGNKAGNATVTFTVTDADGLTAKGTLLIMIDSPPGDGNEELILIISILGSVLGIACILGLYKVCMFLQAAIEGKKLHDAARRKRVRKAIESAKTMLSSCYLVTLDKFKAMDGMQQHEIARDNNWLTTVDDYEELTKLVDNNPTVFISHQWTSWDHPDPEKLQFKQMVAACEEICRRNNFDAKKLYIFLDYLSIPQKNPNLRLAAINTLGVFSSAASFFVVVAPNTVHKDTKKVVDKESYQRRGWCRLEQWGHMCLHGMERMFYYDGDSGKLQDLDTSDSGKDYNWFLESILVFEGEYTNEGNKDELVDVVLGLWSMVLNRKGEESALQKLHDLVKENYQRVFPPQYFSDLPQLLEHMVDGNQQQTKHRSKAPNAEDAAKKRPVEVGGLGCTLEKAVIEIGDI